jgi:hypothetical protein
MNKQSPLYRLWLSIRGRCNNPNKSDYKYYGGRGISVCVQWDSFAQFAADVGPHPGGGLTLDRKNTNGNYSPSNVRWATRQTQARNRPSHNKLIKAKANAIRREYIRGVVRQVDLAHKYGISQVMVSRIVSGRNWL